MSIRFALVISPSLTQHRFGNESALQNFIREKQSSRTSKFDILTGATLLSSVTATIIQTQFGLTDLQTDFNSSVALVLWFASLGFSMVASACSIYQGLQHFIFPFLQTKPPPKDPEATEGSKLHRKRFLAPVTYNELSNTTSHLSLLFSVLTFHLGLVTFMRWLVLVRRHDSQPPFPPSVMYTQWVLLDSIKLLLPSGK